MTANIQMKKYKILPAFIVEDHHEVVPYIHRAIGSKHLPMSDNVLIHFDSHPDLLIPTDLKADDVFNKQVLYDNSSIENWIIPLVYAGHISEIIWFKPPWCEQIKDKTIKFCMGKSKSDGLIRTSCKENYFISEVLYLPEDMVNKQSVTLTVVTVCPRNWQDVDISCASNLPKDIYSECKTDLKCRGQGHCTTDKDGIDIGHCHCVSKVTTSQNSDDGVGSDDSGKDKVCHCRCLNNVSEKLDSENKTEPPSKKIKSDDCDDGDIFHENFVKELEDLFEKLKNRHVILDIDLDFFSTKNPFRELYSEKQYRLLTQLYQFDKPVNDSDEEIQSCVEHRQKQLYELKSAFFGIRDGKSLSDLKHFRSDLIQDLVTDLRKSHDQVDFELLHEAGCTCDDTELPHHVSSEEQITRLVDAAQEVLCRMQKPTVITIARSSNDDYCPPDQVDLIQDKVTEMLRDLYLEISVTEDYEISDSKK